MAMVKQVSMLTAVCMLLMAGAFPASAQYRDRDYDRDRDRDRGPGFSLRFGDDHDRGWRRRDRDCHYVTRSLP